MNNQQTAQAGLLHQLAKSAKQRLKERSYKGEDRAKLAKRDFAKNFTLINANTYKNSSITIKLLDEGCETEFCNKVRAFLASMDKNSVVNPMRELLDKSYMNSLNDLEKQRYIFDIAERYNKIKEDYFNEQTLLNAY